MRRPSCFKNRFSQIKSEIKFLERKGMVKKMVKMETMIGKKKIVKSGKERRTQLRES